MGIVDGAGSLVVEYKCDAWDESALVRALTAMNLSIKVDTKAEEIKGSPVQFETEFESTLNALAKNEGASEEIQARKLRALLVFRCMETAPDDCVEGLIRWTEMWVSDCPCIVRGRRNALSPDAYYTREMCEALKKRNAD